jgi:purine-nucleoside phosphorylase
MGANPLRGRNDPALGPRFPDMARTYTPELIDLAMDVAIEEKIPLHKGVYVVVSGPSYETKAEIEFFGRVGADVVGMSTVPEVIVAAHAGLQVLGISCITNTAWTLHSTTHEEVLETTEKIRDRFSRLIRAIIRKL